MNITVPKTNFEGSTARWRPSKTDDRDRSRGVIRSHETPERELKGFKRIHLKAGETRTVAFDLPQRSLRIWNAEGKWVVEPGAYTLWAGGSSEAKLTAKFQLQSQDRTALVRPAAPVRRCSQDHGSETPSTNARDSRDRLRP